ncbi:MAG: hypothetical protein OPY03_05845 [Nitrosopumilus sp.]|nr:hypothetical protein [Nitrosopumilus sp.]
MKESARKAMFAKEGTVFQLNNDGKIDASELKDIKKQMKYAGKSDQSRKDSVDLDNVTGYNVKSKMKERILNAKFVTMKNGRLAVKGVGSNGTGMFRII